MDTQKKSDEYSVSVFDIKQEKKDYDYIAPSQTADTLFSFVKEIRFLEQIIKNKKISARYCKENIEYLGLGIKEIAFPMKCFCDINMHRLGEHLWWYGYYGIAFSKKWGMAHGIQPLQYINVKSDLCKDFGMAFQCALKSNDKEHEALRDYLALQLMYLKPYSGIFKNRNTGEEKIKCFTDECEWRFVAKVSALGMDEIITNPARMSDGALTLMSNSLDGKNESSICFEYEDIKYIILEDMPAYHTFLSFINDSEEIEDIHKQRLISKILVWSEAKGDF
ncbi:MAG TPA: hypothetical protein IAA04_11940 [Candidatus Lachnoclostridium pullistercoris]|uniref:Uncharacterized protein n=1 Tax=Candidatus Lachnoclostridium pullistercoris TaxID=2838632 RepID=A0A9D2T6E5_9FIRM|nr:hypothetical protein [Candidatus Lachnoclostridium pullistercoris]